MRHLLATAFATAFAIALVSGCGPTADVARVPRALEVKVESARDSVSDNWEGFGRPWFAFVQARCRADGGLVIIFVEQGFGADGDYAYALQGGGAVAWGGGLGIDDPATDEEIIRFFAEAPEIPCPD